MDKPTVSGLHQPVRCRSVVEGFILSSVYISIQPSTPIPENSVSEYQKNALGVSSRSAFFTIMFFSSHNYGSSLLKQTLHSLFRRFTKRSVQPSPKNITPPTQSARIGQRSRPVCGSVESFGGFVGIGVEVTVGSGSTFGSAFT